MSNFEPLTEAEYSPSEDEPSFLSRSFTADWLLAQQFPELRYVVEGIIPEGLSLLVAAPKIGKSWLVLGLGVATSGGGVALGGIRADQAPVLYMALEDGPRRLQSRLHSIGATELSDRLTFITAVPKGDILWTINEYMERYAGQNPVVILDTLGKAMPPAISGETQYERDYRVAGALKAAADSNPGSSVIVVHHTRKADGADFLDAVSGTQGLAGAADTILLLKRARHEDTATLQVTSRDAAEGEYRLDLDTSGVWTLAGGTLEAAAMAANEDRDTSGVGDRMAEVIAAVNRANRPIAPKEIAADLGMDSGQVSTYLTRAADRARIRKAGWGKYTPSAYVESVESVEIDDSQPSGINTINTIDTPPTRGRKSCRVCGGELNRVIAADGIHPTCEETAA